MTTFKALRNLVHRVSGEKLLKGVYFDDTGNYDPTAQVEIIETGKAIPNVRPAPEPIRFRKGFFADTPDATKHLLLGYAIDIVDEAHDDYDKLVKHGVIKTKSSAKTSAKSSKKSSD